MLLPKILLLSALVALGSTSEVVSSSSSYSPSYSLSEFWCGFHLNFCGQSKKDDVNPKANFVLLAFANIQPDGSILVDHANFPTAEVCNWQAKGKKVLISVGGASGNWSFALASNQTIDAFVTTLSGAVQQYNLDGVDMNIEYYGATPRTVAHTITCLKKTIGKKKILMVSPECITVYQGEYVPTLDRAHYQFNYFVPIIKKAGAFIDYYQIQAYNNWYNYFKGGTTDYLIDIYLNWRNLQGLLSTTKPIPNFKGVPGRKIIMGLLGSEKAGGTEYYNQPDIIANFKSYLRENKYPMKGFMIWSSHWDSLNKYIVSNAVKRRTY